MLDICLLGTAGMMPLPNRKLTSCIFRYNGSQILIDCGEGTQVALKKQSISPKPIDVILFTHYHADHISGLPGLLLTMGNAGRTEELTMVGPRRLREVVESLRIIAPELPFDIKYIELSEEVEEFNLYGYRINAFKCVHRTDCYGYTLSIDRGGKFDPERARELEIPLKYWKVLQKGESVTEDGKEYTPDMVLGAPRKGIKVTYCTDTRPTKLITKMAKDSDLAILEGMYCDPEMQEKAEGYKHMTFYESAKIAADANVKELWFTHYSPSLVHAESYMPKVKKIFENSVLSRDGESVTLNFEED
ncbi:MAG: ribonuclease Z [Lachnospiraceae bacterium]|nr:ribonuclease Z [Lachnospiraceae bacterium]